MPEFSNSLETLEGEGLKTAAEFALHSLARLEHNQTLFKLIRGGERIEDPRLSAVIDGMLFENPVLVGAGWDKRGWAVDGLYQLGFAGTEVGSVLLHPQAGNPQPRLWYNTGAGLNRLGFNSKGQEAVVSYLDTQTRPGLVGISLGKNKLTRDEEAPEAHAAVANRLHEYADYFVINVSSPNTPGLRGLLDPVKLTEIVKAVQEVLRQKGHRPLYIKTTVDLALEDLNAVLQVCVDNHVDGVMDSNTTIDDVLKSRYGWEGQAGGLSGDVKLYRGWCESRMAHITKETHGENLTRIGVGAINDTDSALQRIKAGAQAVQVVTGIRQRWGRVAHQINQGLLEKMDHDGIKSIQEYVSVAA